MKIRFSWTWDEWIAMWYREEGYLAFGIGPIYVQIEWHEEFGRMD